MNPDRDHVAKLVENLTAELAAYKCLKEDEIHGVVLFKDAVNSFGIDAQLNKVVEELAELIGAVQRYRQARNGAPESRWYIPSLRVVEEIADVEIVLGQLRYIMEREWPTEHATYWYPASIAYERARKRNVLRDRIEQHGRENRDR